MTKTRFEMKFNDREDHEEWDWLVLENGRVVQGFATSTGAERWINDRIRLREQDEREAVARRQRNTADAYALRRKFDQYD